MRIILTGPDACGKDTQIRELKSWLISKFGFRVKTVSIWDSLNLFSDLTDARQLMQILSVFLLQFEAEARSLFLASTFLNSVRRAEYETSDVLIINGGWEKYAASEATYGVDLTFLKNLNSLMPQADLKILLDTKVSTCLTRRQEWSAYEKGAAKYVSGHPKNLPEFQAKMGENLRKICDETDFNAIDGDGTIAEISKQIRFAFQMGIKQSGQLRPEAGLL